MKKYPDVSELFVLKEARRKTITKLPLEAKMEIANRLRKIAQDGPKKLSAKRPGSALKDSKNRSR